MWSRLSSLPGCHLQRHHPRLHRRWKNGAPTVETLRSRVSKLVKVSRQSVDSIKRMTRRPSPPAPANHNSTFLPSHSTLSQATDFTCSSSTRAVPETGLSTLIKHGLALSAAAPHRERAIFRVVAMRMAIVDGGIQAVTALLTERRVDLDRQERYNHTVLQVPGFGWKSLRTTNTSYSRGRGH